MIEEVLAELDSFFPKKIFLTLDDVAQCLEVPPKVVYNWTRREKNIPPVIGSGKFLRFPRRPFIKWLVESGMA